MVPSCLADPSAYARELLGRGFAHSRHHHGNRAAAWAFAREVFAAAAQSDLIGAGMPPLAVVGEFTVPPAGALRRDFQTLHIDFGLPIEGREALDVARFTALYVEAADDCSALPSTADGSFLCGMEFSSVADERAHFARHGLELDNIEHRIPLRAGELLLFDNLATAHGRVGKRRPEELHQLCAGYRGLDVTRPHTLLEHVLDAFGPAGQ